MRKQENLKEGGIDMIKNNWKKIVSVLMIAVMFSSGPLSDAAPKSAQIEDAEEESVEAEGEDVETTDIEAEDVETEDSETADDEAESDESEEATDEDAEAAEEDAEEEAETGEDSVTPTTNQYVSEIRLFKGDAARKKGESDGWTIVSDGDDAANLNEVLTPNSPTVYLGYKTTDDESEAIRDVKMLEMDRGYQWFDYQKVAEGQMDKLEPMIADLVKASAEFKKNLADGSKAAEKAKAYLNLLYFTGDYPEGGKTSGEKIFLGDYLSSGNVNQQQLKKLIVRMNGGSLLAMFTQLTLALTDTDKSWAERIADADTYKNTKPTSVQRRNWDNSYYEYSMELLPKIQSFAENYRKSVKASGGKGVSDELKDAGDELSGSNIQDVLKAGTEISSAGIAYETAYGMMNKYSVGNEQLGDYILHLGDKNYSTRQDYRELYPLVESLTHGQYGMCKVVGIEQLALYLGNTDETYAKMDEERAKIEKTISRLTKGDKHISVWEGVNTEFYDRPVALTSDAYREIKAGADYTELTREGEFYDTMNLIMMGIGLASSACAVITGVIQLGLLIAGSSLGVWAACTAMIGTGFWATFLGVLGVVATVGGTISASMRNARRSLTRLGKSFGTS